VIVNVVWTSTCNTHMSAAVWYCVVLF